MIRLTNLRASTPLQGSYRAAPKQISLTNLFQRQQTSLLAEPLNANSIRNKWERVSKSKPRSNKMMEGNIPKQGVKLSQVMGAYEPEGEEGSPYTEADWLETGLGPHILTRGSIIKIGRHTNVVAAGRVYTFSVLVVAGDGKGTAGIGYGKGPDALVAMKQATLDVKKNLVSVYRFEDRTISHDTTIKYRATKLVLRRHHKGAGLRGHPYLATLAHCFGFEDLLFKIHGSVNPHNCLRAFVKGVQESVSPAETARATGKVYIDVTKVLNPQLGETPFKFSNMTAHQLWDDTRIFQDPKRILDEGVVIDGAPEHDLHEEELKVARLYQRRMSQMREEVKDVDPSLIDYAKKRIAEIEEEEQQ